MEIFKLYHLNSTLGWDESAYNMFYSVYAIQSTPENDSTVLGFGSDEAGELDISALFRFYVEGIGILVITLLGITANCISAWILSRKKMRTSINCLLLGLTTADSIFISMDIVILAIPTILSHYGAKAPFLVILTPFLYPLATIAHSASVYLTLAITIERYIAICQPFKARSNFTWRQASYIVIGIFLGSFIYNLPKWWEYTAVGLMDKNGTISCYVPLSTNFRRNPIYEKYYMYLSYFLFVYSLPLIILIVFNILIYRAIKAANIQRRMISSSERSETQVARMLVMVVLVYILCNLLPLVNIGAKIIFGSPTLPGVDSIRNFCIILNSCINFVIYCAYGEKFREVFINMCPTWFQRIFCTATFNRTRFRDNSRSRSISSDRTFRTLSISIFRKNSATVNNPLSQPA